MEVVDKMMKSLTAVIFFGIGLVLLAVYRSEATGTLLITFALYIYCAII